MFLEILSFTLLGISIGTFTGLIPGIHVNSVSIMLLGLVPSLIAFGVPTHSIIALIISMAITHTIVDFIPSIFLGAPEDSTALSVLPGHKLLMQGKGLEALFLTIIGGVLVTILFVLLTPLLLLFILPHLHTLVKPHIHIILIFIVILMILTERNPRKIFFSFLVFSFSGVLGYIIFNYPLVPQTFLFFPLFTGLFGISTLLISLLRSKCNKIPPQEKFIWKTIDKALILSGILKSFFSGLLLGILPGVGAAQATVLTQELTRRKNNKEFLISIGGINTAVAIFSILSLYAINRPRSGAAVIIKKILETYEIEFGLNDLILLISIALIVVGISSVLTFQIGKRSLKFLEKIPYKKISIFTILFLILLIIILTGMYGFLILLVSTSIGLVAPLTGVKRSHGMGALLLPVILFYAGI
jgi:putative membrane protein